MKNLKEMTDILEELATRPHHDKPEDYEVVIMTSHICLSGQNHVGVANVYKGHDYDKHRIIIVPDREIVPKERHGDNPLKPIMSDFLTKGTVKPYCPNCQDPVKKEYKYCPWCGQLLDWGE